MFGRLTREGKMTLTFATQEAADLSHPRLGADHLVLGMLCNARTPLFEVLGDNGITLSAARKIVKDFHEDNPDVSADKTAEERYEEDRDALRSIGIDLDKIRKAVGERFGDDLASGWGERADRGRGRGRGRGRDCGPGDDAHGHGGRRERGPRGRNRGYWVHSEGPGAFGAFAAFGPGNVFDQDGPAQPGPFGPFANGGPFGEGGPFGPDFPFGADGPWAPGRGRRGPRGRGSRPRFSVAARDSLAKAVQIARDADDDRLRPEHLLLGIIELGDPAALAVLESGNVSVDELKATVEAILVEHSVAD